MPIKPVDTEEAAFLKDRFAKPEILETMSSLNQYCTGDVSWSDFIFSYLPLEKGQDLAQWRQKDEIRGAAARHQRGGSEHDFQR